MSLKANLFAGIVRPVNQTQSALAHGLLVTDLNVDDAWSNFAGGIATESLRGSDWNAATSQQKF